MRVKLPTWPLAAAALGGLLILVAVSVLTLSYKAQDIYNELDQLNTHHRRVDTLLRRLRSDVHLSGIYIRDYLLDNARDHAPEYRQRLSELRTGNLHGVEELRGIVRPEDRASVAALDEKLTDYWQTFDPLFDWTLLEKIMNSARFLRREVLPRREAVLTIAQQIEELNNANLAAQRAEVMRRQDQFRSSVTALLSQTLLLGLVVALIAVVRLRVVERRSDEQRTRAETAEGQMRQLSQQLVATQEEERRKLSRELHDHVGQMLTALKLEVGRLERTRTPPSAGAGATMASASTPEKSLSAVVAECRRLADTMLHTVRDLALGLRPSMLDDLGLQPALEWHVRDFRRRYSPRVDLSITGDLSDLPDHLRTGVYRIVQEALTNCVRHAKAEHVDINVNRTGLRLDVVVADDGVGFDKAARPNGLGLLGIEERVRELHGTYTLHTRPNRGTRLLVTLPMPPTSASTSTAGSASTSASAAGGSGSEDSRVARVAS
jgi:signal transduction histidine kinase